jgi:hypothetical protein
MTNVMTPSNTPISAGQIGKLQEVLGARLRKSALPSELVQRVLETHDDALADDMVGVLRKRVEAMLILVPRYPASITTKADHDPDSFYRDRHGLYVWGAMRKLVVAKAKPMQVGTTFRLNIADLGKRAADEQIESALSEGHLFEESAVCAIIAELIGQQPEDRAGVLLNNGYANLFYTGSCVVRVYWDAGDRQWDVSAWKRGGRGWSAGRRVFSPAN